MTSLSGRACFSSIPPSSGPLCGWVLLFVWFQDWLCVVRALVWACFSSIPPSSGPLCGWVLLFVWFQDWLCVVRALVWFLVATSSPFPSLVVRYFLVPPSFNHQSSIGRDDLLIGSSSYIHYSSIGPYSSA
ncbi:hypothetical protein V6N12_009647 [Hibiscus sabdariffa]|uniref:Uncharacterized protein n=1 Tax=Hibiscus sabdariffa TaxID=183260 RepID=A0ABR2BVY3_9ROSI